MKPSQIGDHIREEAKLNIRKKQENYKVYYDRKSTKQLSTR